MEIAQKVLAFGEKPLFAGVMRQYVEKPQLGISEPLLWIKHGQPLYYLFGNRIVECEQFAGKTGNVLAKNRFI